MAAAVLAVGAMSLHAAPNVQVVGLFNDAAVLMVDGQRKLVRAGQTGPQGVKVISATTREAVLEIDGVQRTFGLSRDTTAAASVSEAKAGLSVARANNGHYWVTGAVNGQTMQFMVDTGATSIAMNESQGKRLGIDYRVAGTPMVASTAGGNVSGWRVKLNSVKIGGIEVLGVEAVVLSGEFPTDALLGMSWLSRVSFKEDNGVLRLESKH
ncbi:retropepsin-like aspartic protease family protein [Atopomonas sediminilitoris]|uniref:retropepsin-like aspartic protease family protein n=1 Tax=Atopomonas sediminilitoris TaxID=2919919 RepID=UPI001F4E4037|nr:TIGR02281 family clan AA aspartic protease [Atopomonas sediminilitoris]MCJ8170208.1 TIGR02281 family clan AA aspartic protease [Atopomonas sediminilitoris]